jgi:hypothetical protein
LVAARWRSEFNRLPAVAEDARGSVRHGMMAALVATTTVWAARSMR